MDMLKCFLSIEVDDQGKPLPESQSFNRELFVGGEFVIGARTGKVKRLSPLNIVQQYPDLVSDYQGQYPVISLSFQDVDGSSYQAIEEGIKDQIVDLYTENYRYLKQYSQAKETLLEDVEKEQLGRYFTGKLSQKDLKSSLRFLSKLLFRHFGKPVYILIDEYDTPINSIYSAYLECKQSNKPEEFATKIAELQKELASVLQLVRGLLRAALKGNPCLKQGLVTGVFRLAKANFFSGLNNVGEYTVLDKDFATSYGFTQQEVNALLDQVPTSTPPEELQRWYNGYTFNNQVFYNPWSIMRYLKTGGTLDYYWIDSGGTQLIESVLTTDDIQQDIQTLISGGTFKSTIIKQIGFTDINNLIGIRSLLLFGGYLNPSVVRGLKKDQYLLSIPNYEVQRIYKQRLSAWVSRKLEIDPAHYESLADTLASGQIEKFIEHLQSFLYASTSFHQTGQRWAEAFYSGFMLGILNYLSDCYIIESERESGLGRPDTVLIPRLDHDADEAIILEYKVGQQVEALPELAAKGLAQIVDRKYSTQVKMHSHVKSILQVSLAFCGKEVAGKYERVDT
ncbi:MAG: AAA family ATPase, partial [Bacteroidota bacterium]